MHLVWYVNSYIIINMYNIEAESLSAQSSVRCLNLRQQQLLRISSATVWSYQTMRSLITEDFIHIFMLQSGWPPRVNTSCNGAPFYKWHCIWKQSSRKEYSVHQRQQKEIEGKIFKQKYQDIYIYILLHISRLVNRSRDKITIGYVYR